MNSLISTQPYLTLDARLYNQDSESLMRARGILQNDETMESALRRTLKALVEMDRQIDDAQDGEFESTARKLINQGVLCFGTPILTHAGRAGAITAACTVLPLRTNGGMVDIKKFAADSYMALDQAVGTGYDLSDLENPAETLIQLNHELDKINQILVRNNQRPVASMATLRADHPDVINFIRAKRNADFAHWRFNISLFVTEELFDAASADRNWNLRDANGIVVASLPAVELLDEIAQCAHYCGEPGMLFKDRIDEDNPTPQWEYSSTAPCAEVAMAAGEACQFSYVNVDTLVQDGAFDIDTFAEAVHVMTRLLDASVECTIQNNSSLELPLVSMKRRIGVGITGFADLLIRLGIPYSSVAAQELACEISELLDYHSKLESVRLAKRRGPFPAFKNSRYQDQVWLRRKLSRCTGVVGMENWDTLLDQILTHGIRNASTTAMPPTGTSSAIVGSSKSLEPIFEIIDHKGRVHRAVYEYIASNSVHRTPDSVKQLLLQDQAISGISQFPHIETARNISHTNHIAIQANFQKFLDESLAKTINLHNSASEADVLEVLWSAHTHNLKGITVFRDNCLTERDVYNAA